MPRQPQAAPDGRAALVFDLGGTWLRAALAVDGPAGPALERLSRLPSASTSPDELIARMVAMARRADPEGRAEVVGIGAPGPLDPRAGTIVRTPHLVGWRDVPLAARVSEGLGLPVKLHNDANLAGLAESRLGAGRGLDPLVFLTISTGIGGGIIVGGRMHEGHHGMAAELGHILQDPLGPSCPLGHRGCLESLASGSAMARRLAELRAAGAIPVGSPLARLVEGAAEPTAATLADAARSGDALATRLWREMGAALGRGMASLVQALDPAGFVLGGGVTAGAWELFEPAMMASLAADAMTWPERPCVVRRGELGDAAGMVGAALYAFDFAA